MEVEALTDPLTDPLPDLRELEHKVGRKTPQSLLTCIQDAADCVDGWRSHVVRGGASLWDRVDKLREEMKWLRSADGRILRQLVAVHDGIEALRWLMEEEQAVFTSSPSSSLTGSLCSLSPMEEHRPWMSPRRLAPSQTLTEPGGEDSDGPPSDHNHKSHSDMKSAESAEAGSPSPPAFPRPMLERRQRRSSSASRLLDANLPKLPPLGPDAARPQGVEPHSDVIRRALMRSTMPKRKERAEKVESEQTWAQERESFRASRNDSEQEVELNRESILLVYDSQWCWVESQDDVMIL